MENGALPCVFCPPPAYRNVIDVNRSSIGRMSVSTVPGAAVRAGQESAADLSAPSAVLNCMQG